MKEVAVLEMFQEEPGSLTVDQILDSIPKSNKKAQAFIIQLVEHIKNELLTERELDVKIKKITEQVGQTEPMKALKRLKLERSKSKKANQQKVLILLGCRKMAQAAGIDIKEIRAIAHQGELK